MSTMSGVAAHREHALAATTRPSPAVSFTRISPRPRNAPSRDRRNRSRLVTSTSALASFGEIAALASTSASSPSTAAFASSLETAVYAISCSLDSMVKQSLAGPTPATFALVGAAGLATSLSPCTLSVLPLTIGYISGYGGTSEKRVAAGVENEEPSTGTTTTPAPVLPLAVAFAAGTATTLAAAGAAAAAAGTVYLGIGGGLGGDEVASSSSSSFFPGVSSLSSSSTPALLLPLAASAVAVGAGANLLGILRVPLPGIDLSPANSREASVSSVFASMPPVARAFAAGAGAALAASPCSTPVLATLLAYSAAAGTPPLLGAGLLFVYAFGVCAPLVAAAAGAGAAARLLEMREAGGLVQTCAGVVLIAGGVFSALDRLLP